MQYAQPLLNNSKQCLFGASLPFARVCPSVTSDWYARQSKICQRKKKRMGKGQSENIFLVLPRLYTLLQIAVLVHGAGLAPLHGMHAR